jgi:urea carboxylase
MDSVVVVSPVTGVVWKTLVVAGQLLQADDDILVIESMKMEIPVLAPQAGRIVRLLVEEGEAVAEGQPLAELAA